MAKDKVYSIQKIVDREDWQTLRRSLIGTWKKTPIENVQKLRDWLGLINYNCEGMKLRIILNYLTGSGFRTKMISNIKIDNLLDEVRTELNCRKQK